MTTLEPQSEWDGFLGRAPDYKATPVVSRLVWADLSQGLPRDAYPGFPRATEAAHELLERQARLWAHLRERRSGPKNARGTLLFRSCANGSVFGTLDFGIIDSPISHRQLAYKLPSR